MITHRHATYSDTHVTVESIVRSLTLCLALRSFVPEPMFCLMDPAACLAELGYQCDPQIESPDTLVSIVLGAWARPPSLPGTHEEDQSEGAPSTHMELPTGLQATVGKNIKSITFPLPCLSSASSSSNIFSRNHPTSVYWLTTHKATTRATPIIATTPTRPTTKLVLWRTAKGKTKATEHIHLSDIGLGRGDPPGTRESLPSTDKKAGKASDGAMCYQILERYSVCQCVYYQHSVDPCKAYGQRGHFVQEKVVLVGYACKRHSVRQHEPPPSVRRGGHADSGYSSSAGYGQYSSSYRR